jgi:predicted O-methyltransferase YrrM
MTDKRDDAVQRGIQAHAMLYDNNRKEAGQLYFLYDLALLAPNGPAVEVGVYQGGSVVTWAVARKGRGDLYAVDDWSLKNKPARNRHYFVSNMQKYNIEIEIVDGKSWLVADQVPDGLAFCFIDGDHSYYGIPHDVAVWPEKMVPGGIIVFHDYGVPNPFVVVKCIVDAWQAKVKWEHLGTTGSTIAFRKPMEAGE